jgi:hypothetical protein
MGKYASITSAVYSVFNSAAWKVEKIKTFPANLKCSGDKYIKVDIIPSGIGLNVNSCSGVVIIDIHTPPNEGTAAVTLIADKLDNYLQGQTIGPVQFFGSTMAPGKTEDALPKSSYTIPFNYFGAL